MKFLLQVCLRYTNNALIFNPPSLNQQLFSKIKLRILFPNRISTIPSVMRYLWENCNKEMVPISAATWTKNKLFCSCNHFLLNSIIYIGWLKCSECLFLLLFFIIKSFSMLFYLFISFPICVSLYLLLFLPISITIQSYYTAKKHFNSPVFIWLHIFVCRYIFKQSWTETYTQSWEKLGNLMHGVEKRYTWKHQQIWRHQEVYCCYHFYWLFIMVSTYQFWLVCSAYI